MTHSMECNNETFDQITPCFPSSFICAWLVNNILDALVYTSIDTTYFVIKQHAYHISIPNRKANSGV